MLASFLKRLLHRSAALSPQNWIDEALRLRALGRHRELAALCDAVLAREPANLDALSFRASALLAQGRTREGVANLRRATELAPRSADAHASLAAVLAAAGDPEGAADAYRRALDLRPDDIEVRLEFAALLKALGQYDDLEACCRAGLGSSPRHAGLQHALAGALFEQGRVDEAIAEVRAALALNPNASAVHSDLLRMLNYADAQDPAAVYREHRAWDARHAAALTASAPHANPPDPARRLRIGYVSPYFRKHAVTFFLEALIEHHDRERFEVMLYADVAQPDDYSQRLQDHGAQWRSTVGMSDEELARLVRADAVDILVDLSGHTPGHRLLAFARRPAPLQVTWNGYPNTTGMSAMDLRITDAHCDPEGATEHLHSEKLVRLPRIYMAWRPPADAPEVAPPPALAAGHVTFGSFNSCYKLTPRLIALWSRLLARVPQSRLMLLTVGAGAAERRVRDLFAQNGIAQDRIELVPRVTHEEFLAAHARADIALDSFPYHGTTTTCFSLWMGVPVVTLAGAVHASRVGVSLLTNLGAPEWIARDEEDYVEIAARLAGNPSGLAELRSGLRDRMRRSPLTDGKSFARDFENALRVMRSA